MNASNLGSILDAPAVVGALKASSQSSHDAGCHHSVAFYEDSQEFPAAAARFIEGGLRDGLTVLVIARPAHRACLRDHLRKSRLDVQALEADGAYQTLDAAETLAAISVDGQPDAARFDRVVGGLVQKSLGRGQALLAFGEMVDLLCEQGNIEGALKLEGLWNDLQKNHSFSLFCAYNLRHFKDARTRNGFDHICKAHSAVVPSETVLGRAAENEPSRQIAELQQRALALESEIVRRQMIEQQLQTVSDRDRFLAAVVECSDDAIITKSLDGIITSWNKGAERIFGYTADEVIGKPITLLIPEDRQDEEPGILSRLGRGERIDHFETIRRRKDGRLLDVSLTISPVRDASGKIIGASKVARDVTELRKNREAMARANEELERKVAERTAYLRETLAQMEEFSYSVSHDLRAPVRAMQGFARALQEDYADMLDPAGRGYLNRIIAGGNRMQQLIQDILDYSRVGRAEIASVRVPLDSVVREVICQEPAFSADHARITIQADLPAVMGHPLSVGQVISNLLRNAVKFVHPGTTPEVVISAETDNGFVKVSVADNGIGIPAQFQEKLFGLFKRLHSTEQFEGTGVGLAITRKAVERMGGKVGVVSDGVNGSTFWFTLPAAPDAQTSPDRQIAQTQASLLAPA